MERKLKVRSGRELRRIRITTPRHDYLASIFAITQLVQRVCDDGKMRSAIQLLRVISASKCTSCSAPFASISCRCCTATPFTSVQQRDKEQGISGKEDGFEWNDSQPICRQIRNRVIAIVVDGLLREGDPLSSVRTVSAEFRVNPLTGRRPPRAAAWS